jgi:PAT family acetyl-CoA transporter-like MFS transporter 1
MSKSSKEAQTPGARISRFVARARDTTVQKVQVTLRTTFESSNNGEQEQQDKVEEHSDFFNYALLIVLYTLQGIPMGLSASIPFLLQEKIMKMSTVAVGTTGTIAGAAASAAATSVEAAKASYNANAIFALCSWPFSLKLLWAPVVDAVYFKRFGRRKSWLIPVQTLAGLIMYGGAQFVEDQLGLNSISTSTTSTMNVKGVTTFFFCLYFLMATQDIAVDGWALTMLSKANRGKGPICNSIGQNIGYFLSFVGFLAFNDIDASETIWRPLLGLKSNPTQGLISLKGFMRFMGGCMLLTTLIVALFKREMAPSSSLSPPISSSSSSSSSSSLVARLGFDNDDVDEDAELDASEIGLKETYHRLWAVCQLPAVRWLFLIMVTYRLPTALSDNVKFLKAVEYGLSKGTTALLSPTLILPLGILVPIAAHKIWHSAPLQQFATAYQWRVTVVPLLDLYLLHLLRTQPHQGSIFWMTVIASTAAQAICNSLQFNAQMIFFASRVDPAIGGSYMTLLNTAANLGGTWPSSFVMWLLSTLTTSSTSASSASSSTSTTPPSDPYFGMQLVFSVLGIAWLFFFRPKLKLLARLPDEAWRTHRLDNSDLSNSSSGGGGDAAFSSADLESGDMDLTPWNNHHHHNSTTANGSKRE